MPASRLVKHLDGREPYGYPVVFFDALRVKIREDAVVRNKAIALALGVLPDGTRDILGLWIEHTEGAKFWMKIFHDLKTRGVADILIAVTDGLKGMPEALATVFPATTRQTCIVHLIRNRLDDASWKDRKALAAAIQPIDTAPSAEAALAELDAFAQSPWGETFPTVAAAWRRAWDRVIPFFAFPPAIRRVIDTTNAIESINARRRKIIKTRGHFPSDDADIALVYPGQSAYVQADAYGQWRFPGRVIRVGSQMGRKTLRNEQPAERVDTRVLEVLIELQPGSGLSVGLRVDTYLEVGQS